MDEKIICGGMERLLSQEKRELELLFREFGDWVPTSIIKRYATCYSKMKNDWGYSDDGINSWVNLYQGISEWKYPAFYPCGRQMEPDYFSEVVGFIAHVRWATNLMPENGIYELSGDYARRGYMQAKNLIGAGRKVSRLTILVFECVARLRKLTPDDIPTWRIVLENLQAYDDPSTPIIENVDQASEIIEWSDSRGSACGTGFGQFRNIVTAAKKQFNAQK